jgi:putative ABC transport system permease protein
VDAVLTNGADVSVTEPPGADTRPADAAALAGVPGVRGVTSLQHRFAYVGNDLQDLYGVDPTTIVAATKLQDSYFQGGTARELMARLAAQPDSILVSAETARDYQLSPGDAIHLRLQDARTKQSTDVVFTYRGIVNEFPTAPTDSFLVANAAYVATQTGNDAVGTFLVDTNHRATTAVAQRVQAIVGAGAQVSDIAAARRTIGASLTSIELAGLTRVELGFALVLAAAATGLVLWVGLHERRRTLAIAAALGAGRRQLASFVWTEAAIVFVGGLAFGAVCAAALTRMNVRILTGVFDPPPTTTAVPWAYLALFAGIAALATLVASAGTVRATRRPAIEVLRDL